ncbi:MAG: rod shape-determining protein MreC [Clostridiaceae bacterium]|nr:rod shape-determining protein MreC [Clostridiaceae bacterium]
MLRFFKSKWFVLSLITIALLVVMGISANENSKLNWLNNIVSVPMKPIQGFFSSIGREIDDFLSFFKEMEEVKKENDVLRAEVAELRKQNREMSVLESKNEELRQALNLKEQFGDYTIHGANIIAVDPSNWFNAFKIDIGTTEGIDSNFPVVTSSRGLVGRVVTSDISTSTVQTIIDVESAISGWIAKAGGGHAIVRGDMELKGKGLCKMDYIPLEVDVEVGDIIETSGLGGYYPKGIVIGEVIEVRKSNSELDRYAIIQPAADFKRLEEVFVLKRNKNIKSGSAEE